MAIFDVNTDASIALTAKLEKLHRSAFPVAVRQTLNRAAFTTKREMPNTAKKAFRKSNRPGLSRFIRAFSAVDKATGFSLPSMKATVGINPAKGSDVAKGLEKQEYGGVIESRKLIPHDKGRTSGSFNKRVKSQNRFNKISFVSGRPSKNRSRKSNIVAQAYVAAQTGKHLLIHKNKSGSNGTVFKVRGVSPKGTGSNRSVKIRLTPIYVYRHNSKSRVKSSPFVRPAAKIAAKQLDEFYSIEADKQFKRLLK